MTWNALPPALRRRHTVLLVEDELPVRMVLSRTLEEAGYRVVTASNGQEALRLAEQQVGFDAVITDLAMPRMSGQELAARLAQRTPTLPMLFISGFGASADRAELPGPLLLKPFDNEWLLDQLSRMLDAGAH